MSELKNIFNFANRRLAGLQRKIPISQAKKCIVQKYLKIFDKRTLHS